MVLVSRLDVNTGSLFALYLAVGPLKAKGNQKKAPHQVHLPCLGVLLIPSLCDLTGKHQANLTYMF